MYLHDKKLVCGYRRPKNLRDLLMKAKVDPLDSDKQNNPFHKQQEETPVMTQVVEKKTIDNKLKQRLITDFTSQIKTKNMPKTSCSLPNLVTPKIKKPISAKKFNRGFNFCNNPRCRFCPLLNKTGEIKSTHTNEKFNSMKNVSCRSSNLIYCITCTVCYKQYVGQTSNRIRDRFQGHFNDVTRDDKDKAIPLHFNSPGHRGTKDMEITVLEFIKKSPKTEQAMKIRLRIEKHWTYTLHTLSPIGLNMENPKEFKIKNK